MPFVVLTTITVIVTTIISRSFALFQLHASWLQQIRSENSEFL
jgi:NhaP-type Na+/H+ and K+/H+ antiporter